MNKEQHKYKNQQKHNDIALGECFKLLTLTNAKPRNIHCNSQVVEQRSKMSSILAFLTTVIIVVYATHHDTIIRLIVAKEIVNVGRVRRQ